MKILHVSFSSTGGAGYAAKNLNRSLKELGIDSNFKYLTKRNLLSTGLLHPILLITSLIDFFVVKKQSSTGLFSMFRRSFSRVAFSESSSDIIHLHWVPGILHINQVLFLLLSGKRIVWTIHDSFPFSGGCHVQISCPNLSKSCINCPQSKKKFHHRVYFNKIKKRFLLSHKNMYLIAPSQWMKNEIERSGVGNKCIYIVPNLVNSNQSNVQGYRGNSSNMTKHLENSNFRIGIVVNSANDKIKRIHLVDELLEEINIIQKKTDRKILFCIYGKGSIKLKHNEAFFINSKIMDLNEFYLSTHIVVSLSQFESFGNSIVEANSYGKPVLILGGGGQRDLIFEGQNGFCFENLKSMAERIVQISRDVTLLEQMSNQSLKVYSENFSPERIIKSHLEIYRTIMNDLKD